MTEEVKKEWGVIASTVYGAKVGGVAGVSLGGFAGVIDPSSYRSRAHFRRNVLLFSSLFGPRAALLGAGVGFTYGVGSKGVEYLFKNRLRR